MRDCNNIDKEPEGQRKQRIVAGMVSSALSVLFHVIVFILVARLTFMLPAMVQPPERTPRIPPMKLEDIRHEERIVKQAQPVTDRGSGGGAGGDAVSAAVGSSLEKGVENLARVPREVVTEPTSPAENRVIGDARNIVEPGPTPARNVWQPRQEIVEIGKYVVADEIKGLPRRNIPSIERIKNAPDVVAQVDRDAIGKTSGGIPGEPMSGQDVAIEDLLRGVQGGGIGGGKNEGGPRIEEPTKTGKAFSEEPSKITAYKAIEKLLVAEVTVYTSIKDWKYGYFKLEIKRAGAEVLPVLPKDILLIQDCSNSMDEQRLHFCRDGMVNCLAEIGPADRFNIVKFREKSENCFGNWAANNPENIEKAKQFIKEMIAEGNTDIFTAISEQMNVKRTPGRPVVALLVSDGIPTSGMVASTDIIGEFSKLNNGAISVFAMGTLQTANKYLLDLLGYCNRGDAFVVTSGRWDVPVVMHKLVKEVSRPVLSETEFHFAADSQGEVYPMLASNLYLDRALVMYGRYPRGTKNVVLQAIGKAGDIKCDMVFNLDLENSIKKGDREVMEMWAKQKIYHIIAQNARKPAQSNLDAIHSTAHEYGIKVPYKRQLK